MLVCQFQIFETKQSRNDKGKYDVLSTILSGQDQGYAASDILVSD